MNAYRRHGVNGNMEWTSGVNFLKQFLVEGIQRNLFQKNSSETFISEEPPS